MTEQQASLPETRESDAVINDALGVIDEALAQMLQRELMSTGEVADLLLDVRSLLTTNVSPDEAAPATTATAEV